MPSFPVPSGHSPLEPCHHAMRKPRSHRERPTIQAEVPNAVSINTSCEIEWGFGCFQSPSRRVTPILWATRGHCVEQRQAVPPWLCPDCGYVSKINDVSLFQATDLGVVHYAVVDGTVLQRTNASRRLPGRKWSSAVPSYSREILPPSLCLHAWTVLEGKDCWVYHMITTWGSERWP